MSVVSVMVAPLAVSRAAFVASWPWKLATHGPPGGPCTFTPPAPMPASARSAVCTVVAVALAARLVVVAPS